MRTFKRYVEVQTTLETFRRLGLADPITEAFYQQCFDDLWARMSAAEKQAALAWGKRSTVALTSQHEASMLDAR